MKCRIIFESREHYRVMDSKENIYKGEMAGRVRTGNLWPAVGDWVEGSLQPGDWVQITEVFPRSSVLERKDPHGHATQVLAANVDVLFIVTSANQDLSENRLDRYIALAKAGNIKPVVLVNKIELASNADDLLTGLKKRFSTVDVLGVSAFEGTQMGELDKYVTEGKTIAFVGSSGVGKSTLTNYLLGGQKILTQEIRSEDDRGRHTTTHRELHITLTGATLIDTPGIRMVGLTEDADLSGSFSDVEELFTQCKFGDCSHETEPGCAVKLALESGELTEDRWESFLKLSRERAYEKRKSSKALRAEEKKKWIKIHKDLRARMKVKSSKG